MKVSLDQVRQAEGILRKLAVAPLPAVTAFHTSRFLKEVNELFRETKEIERKLFDKYGKPDGQGNITILSENEEAFRKELTELLSVEVELKSKELNLKELDSLTISPAEIFALEPFLSMG